MQIVVYILIMINLVYFLHHLIINNINNNI
jgi:hypothetical protein